VAELADGSAASLAAALRERPDGEPSFAILRFPAGEAAPVLPLVLFSFCPDNSSVRLRMIHSSAKPAVRALVEAAGLEVDKSVETQDLEDVTEAWLCERVVRAEADTEDDAAAVRRPAPKGGRRILRKADPEVS